MEIKKEEPKDYAEIYEVVKRAFNSAECADGNERLFINEQFDLIKNRVYKPSKYSAKQMLDIMKEHHKIWDKATKSVIDDPQWLEETKNKEDKEKAMLEKCNKQFIY